MRVRMLLVPSTSHDSGFGVDSGRRAEPSSRGGGPGDAAGSSPRRRLGVGARTRASIPFGGESAAHALQLGSNVAALPSGSAF